MAAVRNSAETEKEVESAEYYTQELSGSYTSSPTTSTCYNNNSSVGPQQWQFLDSHQSLLNGAQPNPFVCGGVLAAPCTDDSLPSGALVNGSASHCTSEEPNVPDKDASPLPGTDTNPEVLEPPCELQSNTWQKPEGHILKAASTRTLSELDNSDCETPLVGYNADKGGNSRVQTNNGIKAGSLWDVDSESESSESSSDNYDGLNRSIREKFMCFLLKGRILDEVVKGKIKLGSLQSANSRRRKRKTCGVKKIPLEQKVDEGFSCSSLINMNLDFDSSISEERSSRQESESLKTHTNSHLGNSQDEKNLISSENVGGRIETDTCVGGQPMSLKRELETGMESEHSFFQCTKCNVNFKEKRHLHRHMMYHLDRNNEVGQVSILRPFICKECGRSFSERSSLQNHMLIHQVQRERLMEEIKDLNETRSQGGEAQLQCPRCAFRTKCPQTFIHHAKTHGKDKPYYSCEECDHIVSSKSDMEVPQQVAHLNVCQGRVTKPLDMTFFCKICTFRTKYRDVLKKHQKLVHDQSLCDHELQSRNMANNLSGSVSEQERITGQNEDDCSAPSHKPKFLRENENTSGAGLSAWSSSLVDLFLKDNSTQKSCKNLSSSLIKWSFDSLASNLSPCSPQCDKPSKLSLPTERIDVTTGLSYIEEDNQKCESAISKQNTKHLSSYDMNLLPKSAISSKAVHLNHDDTSKYPSPGSSLVEHKQKFPSKRKMSIPYHNTPKKIPMILPKPESANPEILDVYSLQSGNYSSANFDYANQANDANGPREGIAPFLDCNNATDTLPLQEHLLKDDVPSQSDVDNMEDDINTFIVKEENMEIAVSENSPDCTDPNLSGPYINYCVSPVFETDRKCCPYCPAVFESGVGLSNHIRGHLHRCGLSYEARHMLSPEQVASQDRQPRVRRRAPSMSNRIRRDKPESQTEYTCPLCLGWFDTKTGLSNHVRGHLKRIGKPIAGASKSPLCILNELLQDENEHRNVLRALEAKPRLSRPIISRKFAGSHGPFLAPTSVPVKLQNSSNTLVSEEGEKRKITEKIIENSESTLVELLKRQRSDQELAFMCHSKTARARFIISPSKKVSTEAPPDSICSQGKFEGKKICIHCNATFQSGVSLSNHLRAYARRKRIAMLEGTSYDCNQKLPRSRSVPKRKAFRTLHPTSEVIYTLTCRFCDLVFQGPQCVQEDWVKHLQRHLMHTAVRGTGAGMVEVPAVCEEPCAPDCATQGL